MTNVVDVVDALLKKNKSAAEKFTRQQFLCLHILTMGMFAPFYFCFRPWVEVGCCCE